ncbi:MAG: B12-binding domain-containing radical SAM protein [Bacteroidales bacterium]
MSQSILFITPPFTQLNTPYPATACLKGFMNTQGVESHQCDVGLEVVLGVFSGVGLGDVFELVDKGTSGRVDKGTGGQVDGRTGGQADRRTGGQVEWVRRMVGLRGEYLRTIGLVMEFLQGGRPEVAHLICSEGWLPEGRRFGQMTDLDHDFGHLGLLDRAKYLATLYIEDISDLITETVDPHFGFSRYAERLGRSAGSFDELALALEHPGSFIDTLLTGVLREKISQYQPSLVALTVPFPGNLYGALKCGQWLKRNHPEITVAMGGGFVNTELRSLSDPRVFDFVDFITLDDGEAPLLHLTEYLDGQRSREALKRTFMRWEGKVCYVDGSAEPDVAQRDTGIPDYSELLLHKYLSVLEVANPMHRLWSDGRWNKLMLAHGCYWGKCSFCDGSLDYIKRYEPKRATQICDAIEAIIAQTGHHGFHFTDEAAAPVLLRELALEILRRKLTVVWWTNIRFEAGFTYDLCRLLKASGCIAVAGGLEVASDRILKMINKGVTVTQVARVADHFTQAGIMVHAYLMYGFPTQTAQETVDSLEVVRQLFHHGIVQSGFWHLFAMTVHSPVGQHPEQFGVEKEDTPPGAFANNDLVTIDQKGCDHEAFGEGLKKSLYNYMHGICFDFPLQEWFDFRIPRTTVAPAFIQNTLSNEKPGNPGPHAKMVWTGAAPSVTLHTRLKKGKQIPSARMVFQTNRQEVAIVTSEALGVWLSAIFPRLLVENQEPLLFQQFEKEYTESGLTGFNAFREGPVIRTLKENGLLIL